MVCCGADSVLVEKMALEVKTGPMLWYKRRFFRSNWRNVYCVLKNDSKLQWYKDRSRHNKDGEMVLKEAPELIAFIPYTSQVLLPYANKVLERHCVSNNYVQKKLLAFGVKGKDRVHCFLCPNEEEVPIWMSAILSTIPAPLLQLPFLRSKKDQKTSLSSEKKLLSQNPHQITGKQSPTTDPPFNTTENQLQPLDNKRGPPSVLEGAGIAVSMIMGAAMVLDDLAHGRTDEERTALGPNLDEDVENGTEQLQQGDDFLVERRILVEDPHPYEDFVNYDNVDYPGDCGDYYGGDFGGGGDDGNYGAEYMACFAIF